MERKQVLEALTSHGKRVATSRFMIRKLRGKVILQAPHSAILEELEASLNLPVTVKTSQRMRHASHMLRVLRAAEPRESMRGMALEVSDHLVQAYLKGSRGNLTTAVMRLRSEYTAFDRELFNMQLETALSIGAEV